MQASKQMPTDLYGPTCEASTRKKLGRQRHMLVLQRWARMHTSATIWWYCACACAWLPGWPCAGAIPPRPAANCCCTRGQLSCACLLESSEIDAQKMFSRRRAVHLVADHVLVHAEKHSSFQAALGLSLPRRLRGMCEPCTVSSSTGALHSRHAQAVEALTQ